MLETSTLQLPATDRQTNQWQVKLEVKQKVSYITHNVIETHNP